jgi:uncharacterized RDD family membrane protein YckC
MKCPKCQYLSFGNSSRCRNCGYDFSLAENPPDDDLPINPREPPMGPLADLPLAAPSRTELPLFSGTKEDAPLVNAAAVPRAPLSVRRNAPAPPKHRARTDVDPEPALDLEDPSLPRAARTQERDEAAPLLTSTLAAESAPAAPVLSRIAAAVIDLLIVGAIDAAVVYLTVRLCNLQFADAMTLPKVPMAAFLLLLNGGYFVLFTAAGGQTIGKMAGGIRVVPQQRGEWGDRVAFSTAVLRASAYLASLLPAGLGFVPILFSHDGRTLHDRLSDTRVVKA